VLYTNDTCTIGMFHCNAQMYFSVNVGLCTSTYDVDVVSVVAKVYCLGMIVDISACSVGVMPDNVSVVCDGMLLWIDRGSVIGRVARCKYPMVYDLLVWRERADWYVLKA
ncbi:hypothetical protein THOM_0617, partial [Trachipleistophora hominis]